MLPKKQKLTRAKFPTHHDKKVIWNGTALRVCCYKKDQHAEPRFAVVVSKKQYKTIVARNLFKRRVFSVLEKHTPLFLSFQFGRYVFFPKFEVEKITPAAIKEDIAALISECAK